METDIIDYYEERAAIREYDGGQVRQIAEREAVKDTARSFSITLEQVRRIAMGGGDLTQKSA